MIDMEAFLKTFLACHKVRYFLFCLFFGIKFSQDFVMIISYSVTSNTQVPLIQGADILFLNNLLTAIDHYKNCYCFYFSAGYLFTLKRNIFFFKGQIQSVSNFFNLDHASINCLFWVFLLVL